MREFAVAKPHRRQQVKHESAGRTTAHTANVYFDISYNIRAYARAAIVQQEPRQFCHEMWKPASHQHHERYALKHKMQHLTPQNQPLPHLPYL